jgi:SAM-dependent methyltransferase
MDLRELIRNDKQLKEALSLVVDGSLLYQPFIISDDLEVGEGLNLAENYANVKHVTDTNVYAADTQPFGTRVLATDKEYFRKQNQQYRDFYNFITDTVCEMNANDVSKLSVGEIGCNSGLNLFNLAVRGAKYCAGYDWTDYKKSFAWLNKVLGTKVDFFKGGWDNLYHRFDAGNIQEFDIMINTVFTNHQCDPLQFLAYICDRARKGVFLCILTSGAPGTCLEYPNEQQANLLENSVRFPLNFNNGMAPTYELLMLCLKKLGFEDVTRLSRQLDDPNWQRFNDGFSMFYAKRTSNIKSAYWK